MLQQFLSQNRPSAGKRRRLFFPNCILTGFGKRWIHFHAFSCVHLYGYTCGIGGPLAWHASWPLQEQGNIKLPISEAEEQDSPRVYLPERVYSIHSWNRRFRNKAVWSTWGECFCTASLKHKRDCCIANLISFGNAGIWPQQWQKPALQGHFFQGFRRGVSYRGTIQSSRHRRGNMDDTGHLVAYIIKLQGGVGIVLSYKGSTNMADWKANMKTFSKKMFPDSDKEEVMVHNGFLQHKERLDKRMLQAKMAPIAKLLSTWGVSPFENFRDFLLSGQWKWCICVGHSLGGAMSAIAALELAVYGAGNPVYAIGIGTAIPGNQQFSWLMDKHVRPKGGLRIANEGDAIAFMGLGGVSFSESNELSTDMNGFCHTIGVAHISKGWKITSNMTSLIGILFQNDLSSTGWRTLHLKWWSNCRTLQYAEQHISEIDP